MQDAGFVMTREFIAKGRELAERDGRALINVLEEQSSVSSEQFMAALALAFEFPSYSMRQLQAAVPRFDLIAFADCMSRMLVMVNDASTGLVLVRADPFAPDPSAWVRGRLKTPFDIVLAHRSDLSAFLAQQEEKMRAIDSIVAEASAVTLGADLEELSLVSISEDASPVVRLVNSTLYDALKMGVSDIHLECDADRLHIKYRIDGVLVAIGESKGLEVAEQVISRVKVLAELDIAERRIPQDGRFKVLVKGREIDFRVSIMPSLFGEDAVLRLLDRRAVSESHDSLTLASLSLNAEAAAAIRALSAKPHGMLLVTGPTGSGKTTTLYAAISEINNGRDKIITIEDPVEYRLPKILQIPVNEKKGLTFARGLRSILRHDPDKIMVGEIRDSETAEIAVQAALTGHLVLTTVHANNVYDVLGRFLHMEVDPYSFSAALNGIVAQRLLRMLCEHCAISVEPDSAALRASGLNAGDVKDWRFRNSGGCGHCRGTGYKGRRAVAEVLVL
ncbi:MAG: type II/IV secretion system protein, partial [Betaproteobacteria bacterium]|nr:type II/IV secretion system protein [Betaproteobacteria bacterium]